MCARRPSCIWLSACQHLCRKSTPIINRSSSAGLMRNTDTRSWEIPYDGTNEVAEVYLLCQAFAPHALVDLLVHVIRRVPIRLTRNCHSIQARTITTPNGTQVRLALPVRPYAFALACLGSILLCGSCSKLRLNCCQGHIKGWT